MTAKIEKKIPASSALKRMWSPAIWSIFCGWIVCPLSYAQEVPVRWSERTLIVVLPTSHQQIDVWREAHEADPDNPRFRRNLEREIQDAKFYASEMKEAMTNFYDFSTYLFVADSSLQGRKLQGYIQATSPEGEEKMLPNQEVWFALRSTTGSGAHGIVLCNQEMEQIERPFPSFYRLTRTDSFLQAFVGKSDHSWRPLGPLVKKMNEKLHKYRQRMSRR